jgi:hypothetical protein
MHSAKKFHVQYGPIHCMFKKHAFSCTKFDPRVTMKHFGPKRDNACRRSPNMKRSCEYTE